MSPNNPLYTGTFLVNTIYKILSTNNNLSMTERLNLQIIAIGLTVLFNSILPKLISNNTQIQKIMSDLNQNLTQFEKTISNLSLNNKSSPSTSLEMENAEKFEV